MQPEIEACPQDKEHMSAIYAAYQPMEPCDQSRMLGKMEMWGSLASRYATLKSMKTLSALNQFGTTSAGIVKTCSVPCSDEEKYRFKTTWTPDCCKLTMHLGCANKYMTELGTSMCPSCWVPFHGKKPAVCNKASFLRFYCKKPAVCDGPTKKTEDVWIWIKVSLANSK